MHNEIKAIDGIKIAGWGGSNPTPFDTPLEFEEEEIYQKLSSVLKGIPGEFILATHAPPKDTKCDVTSQGIHAGSSAIRKIVEEFQPTLVVSSHVHEAGRQEDHIGKSTLVNIGRLGKENLGIMEINDRTHLKCHSSL